MADKISERRLAENEAAFREANERVKHEFEALQRIAKEEDHKPFPSTKQVTVHFYCECSNPACRERIIMTLHTYIKLHKKHNQFILIPGHEIPSIEHTVKQGDAYIMVEKRGKVPRHATPFPLPDPGR